MSFLKELEKKKKELKSSKTVVTLLDGGKYWEIRNNEGKVIMQKLPETGVGFVIDEKLDLQIVEVMKYLYLSSQDVAQDFKLLTNNGITHVLSVGVDPPHFSDSCKIKFKKIEVLDEPAVNISAFLDSCIKFIESARMESKTNKVLVHCNAGYSRAPTVIIAYLMTKHRFSLNESFQILKEKRNIKPNEGFLEQLKALEKNLKL